MEKFSFNSNLTFLHFTLPVSRGTFRGDIVCKLNAFYRPSESQYFVIANVRSGRFLISYSANCTISADTTIKVNDSSWPRGNGGQVISLLQKNIECLNNNPGFKYIFCLSLLFHRFDKDSARFNLAQGSFIKGRNEIMDNRKRGYKTLLC